MTSRVYGSKVKEPKIVRRNFLPAEDLTADLANAWSKFGEAKSVLQRLESKTVSPPAKDSRRTVSFKPPTYHSPERAKVIEPPAPHVNTSKGTEALYINQSKSLPVSRSSSAPTQAQTTGTRLSSSTDVGRGNKRPLPGEVPIRRFDLPPEVARALASKVEQQKLAMSGHQTSKHKQGAGVQDYNPQGYQDHTQTTSNVIKRRKVASAPPPRSYSGFSSAHSRSSQPTPSTTRTTLQWKPSVEREGGVARGQRTKEQSTKVGHSGSKVRKVHRMPASAVQSESTVPSGIITTSSWRAGKQLTDKILREKPPITASVPSPPDTSSASSLSSVRLDSTSLRQKSGVTAAGPPSNRSSENKFGDILADLELSSNTESATEEVGKEEKKRGVKRTPSDERETKKKQKLSSEPAHSTERSRHYDQSKIQTYIQRQREERRKKVLQESKLLAQASSERQKKLQELYETQRKRVELNLRKKQKKREEYAKSLSSGIHIHLHDHTPSIVSEDDSLPTLTVTHAPRTTERSPRQLSTRRTHTSVHTSPPSHLRPSPPPHPSPKVSPNRQNRLHRNEPHNSPYRSATSPRTYTFQQTSSPSSNLTEHAQLSPRAPPSSSPTVTAGPVFRPSPPKSPRSYDERLQAIRASALRLKEQIAMESQRALDRSYEEAVNTETAESVPRYHHQANEQGRTPLTEFPGVHNVREHALLAEQHKRENEAALKIQAAVRGHNVRKILKIKNPSPQSVPPPVAPPTTVPSVCVSISSAAAPSVTMTTPLSVVQSPPLVCVHEEVAPWKQGGGDTHSVINVFTRQHEQLRETLNLLSDQKREEIRSVSSSEKQCSPGTRGVPQHAMVDQLATPTNSGQSSPNSKLSPFKHSTAAVVSSHDTRLLGTEAPAAVNVSPQSESSLSQDSLYTPPRAPPPASASTPLNNSLETDQSWSFQGTPKSHSLSSHHNASSEENSSSTAVNEEDAPAITPPGSVSFVDSFSTLSPHPPHVPPPSTSHTDRVAGRLSPRSLELEHHAQLNLYETIEENLRHLSQVEQTRGVSQAQHETVTLAQQLKAQEQARASDLSALAAQAKMEVAQRQLESESQDKMRELEERMNSQVREHSKRMAEESERAVREATLKLSEARSAATSAVIEAAHQQVEAAHTLAVSVATAATKEAVQEVLRHSQPGPARSEESESDLTAHPDRSGEENDQTSSRDGTGGETSNDTTLTPPLADETLVNGGEVSSHDSSPPEVPEDITEVLYRELLPSESHCRSQPPPLSDFEASPSSRPQTPSQGEQSPYSPAREESFYTFTSRMAAEYVKEEEVRARHRAALLELREKALQEKTSVQLKWLQLKQKDLRSKGADDLMPPLKKKERGVLRGFQKEKAEIQRLKKAQEAAAHERKLMLLEQQEISRMRKSAQFYREKIRSYRSRSHASPSPAPSVDESIYSHLTHSIATEYSSLSDLSGLEEGLATPTEHLNSATFPTYSPSTLKEASTHKDATSELEPAGDRSGSLQTESSLSEHLEASVLDKSSKKKSVSPLVRGKKGESPDAIAFKKLEASEAERYLAQRKLSLEQRRQAAVEIIEKHRELLKKEKELDREEKSVNKLLEQAMEMLRQTPLSASQGPKLPRDGMDSLGLSPALLRISVSGGDQSQTPSSVTELLNSTESVAEQLSASRSKERTEAGSGEIPSEYAADTFESLDTTLSPSHRPHPVTASTPEMKEDDEVSVRDTESIADSVSTTTSSGSGLEARIRALKEQLRQRKEEVRKVQSEQRRKKKAILKQHEEQLLRKIQAVDQKTKNVMTFSPPRLVLSPDTPSSVSEAESGDKSPSESASRESSPETTDQTVSSRDGSGSPELVSSRERSPIATESRERSPIATESRERSPIATELTNSPLPVENHLPPTSPPEEPSFSYTPFSVAKSVEKEDSKDLTLTGHSTEPVHTELELEDENEILPEVDGMESRLELEEALVPPPGFEVGEHPSHSDQAPPPASLSTTDQQTAPVVTIEPTVEEVAKSEKEDAMTDKQYPDDFEPLETVESLEAGSDTSLSISLSGSKGGDSEEEMNFSPGQRVLVGGVMEGVVRYVGKTHFKPGLWIGVEFSEPRGRNDGSIDDHRYFNCLPRHGLFAPPKKVEVIEDIEEEESSQESIVTEELESEDDVSMSGDKMAETSDKEQYSDDFEPSIERENEAVDKQSLQRSLSPDNAHSAVLATDTVSEHISDVVEESTASEQTAPAEIQLIGEKPDGLPSAPKALAQHLQPATPTPAPPPEFAEGASRERSIEPPPLSTSVEHLEPKPEKFMDELTQELMNEAYETMHKIWKSKRPQETPPEQKVDVVQIPRDKEVPLSLGEKADQITDQLLALLLQSETNLMSNILSSKEHAKKKPAETEPTSPVKRHSTLRISIANIKECSPPPLSPPSPYRIPPASMPPVDLSPPTTPPCHLSQVIRATAGDNSQESGPTPGKLERTYSTESIVQRLDAIKVTTAQCMVPSERAHIDTVVKQAWNIVMDTGIDSLHTRAVQCPEHILCLFKDIRELSPEEDHCHKAYIQLVFGLTIDAIKQLHPVPPPTTPWLQGSVARGPLRGRGVKPPSLELVQKRVYAALIRGQLPADLPAVKFLHRRKRPGGKEVDFVDGILIKELRYEEPSWVDYHNDEVTVKMRTADSILDSLLTEAVQIMCNIEQKRKQQLAS